MKGKYLHINLATALVKSLRQRGGHVQVEYPVRRGQRPPAVDILAQVAGLLLAIEIECSIRRIPNDLMKVEALRPDIGLIVMPNARLARAARSLVRRLSNNYPIATATIQVMTFGAALQWVANNCPIKSVPQVAGDI